MDTNDRAQFLIFPQDPPRRWGDGKDLLNDALYDELDTLDTASFAEPGRDLEYAGTLGTPGTPGAMQPAVPVYPPVVPVYPPVVSQPSVAQPVVPVYRPVVPPPGVPAGNYNPRPQVPMPAPTTAPVASRPVSRPRTPGDVLNLRNWSLALPIPFPGTSKPLAIDPPQLLTYSSEYFKLNADGTGVVFKAHAGGVHSQNSHYPRSELRELINGKNAAWSSNKGVHTMTFVEAVTNLPVKKPHVCAAQIHGTVGAPVMIRLEGTKLWVTSDGDKITLLEPNYRLGTKYKCVLTVANGVCTVIYNDKPSARVPIDDDGCYWKIGTYTLSSTAKVGESPSAYGEEVVYSVDVTHR